MAKIRIPEGAKTALRILASADQVTLERIVRIILASPTKTEVSLLGIYLAENSELTEDQGKTLSIFYSSIYRAKEQLGMSPLELSLELKEGILESNDISLIPINWENFLSNIVAIESSTQIRDAIIEEQVLSLMLRNERVMVDGTIHTNMIPLSPFGNIEDTHAFLNYVLTLDYMSVNTTTPQSISFNLREGDFQNLKKCIITAEAYRAKLLGELTEKKFDVSPID